MIDRPFLVRWSALAASLVAALGTSPIRAGEAEAEAHWAFAALVRPTVPGGANPGENPIDAFVGARLGEAGLAPAPRADRGTLIRRVTFDLIGLPPSPEEIADFLDDRTAGAYEKVVDRLLASPAHGERWARHWLDVARFGESDGFEFDKLRANAWPYRDYVIRSFNDDRPFADFVRDQIAGDLRDDTGAGSIAATGFLVAGPWDEANNIQSSAIMRARTREDEVEDMVAAAGQAFLGVTVNCARCHDHKFDPIPQADYYRMASALAGVRHGDRPAIPWGEVDRRAAKKAALVADLAEVDRVAVLSGEDPGRRDDAIRRRAGIVARIEALSVVPQVYGANPKEAGVTRILLRGDVEKPAKAVSAGGLSAAAGPPSDLGVPSSAPEAERRRKLAEWIASPENPLTYRTIANRLWHYHFSAGLVATPNDLGAGGERPSHPELLDWLASELRENGGHLKAMHRRIVTSETYRRSSRFDAQAASKDADSRLLWRFPPRRLEAEAIRDAALAASGELNPAMYGPSVRPFTVKVFGSNLYTLTEDDGPGSRRRTIYRMNVVSAKDPLLESLDCPDPAAKAPRRGVTTTPLQALSLMNAPFVARRAKGLADRTRREVGDDPARRVDRAYLLALGRTPSDAERARAIAMEAEHGMEPVAWMLLNASEFSYVH